MTDLSSAEWVPPYVVHGNRPQVLVVEELQVQLGDVVHEALREVAPDIAGHSSCSLLEFLLADRALARVGQEFGWAPQVVWQLAAMLEPRLLGRSSQQLSLGDWVSESLLQLSTGAPDYGQRAGFLQVYGQRNTQLLKECQVVGIAVDDSRVARRAWKLLATITPSRKVAAWLFPQAW